MGIILQNVLNDSPDQALQLNKKLQKAENGELKLLIPEPVISDVVFVLSHYALICQRLETAR